MKNNLQKPVDSFGIALFRIAISIGVIVDATRNFLWTSRENHFKPKYFGFEWIDLGSADMTFLIVTILLALALITGFLAQLFAGLLFLVWTTYWLDDITLFNNHYYLMSLSFLLVAVLGGGMPVHKMHETRNVPNYVIQTFRLQISLVYFFGGIAKFYTDWFNGNIVYSILNSMDMASMPLIYLLTYGGLFLDLLCPFGFFFRRTRLFTFVLIATFHIFNIIMFGLHIGGFPYMMLIASALYFDGEQLRKLFRIKKSSAQVADKPYPMFYAYFAIIYLVIQLVLPLRAYFYPGDVVWHRHGYYFTWRMMLAYYFSSGADEPSFRVRDPKTGREQMIPLAMGLKEKVRLVIKHPDAVHQYALYLEKEIKEKFKFDPEIYANYTVRMNGQSPSRPLDPNVDLTKVKRSPWPQEWNLDQARYELKLVEKMQQRLEGFWGSIIPKLDVSDDVREKVYEVAEQRTAEYAKRLDEISLQLGSARTRMNRGDIPRDIRVLGALVEKRYQLMQERDYMIYQQLPENLRAAVFAFRIMNEVRRRMNDIERFKVHNQIIRAGAMKSAPNFINSLESLKDYRKFAAVAAQILADLPE